MVFGDESRHKLALKINSTKVEASDDVLHLTKIQVRSLIAQTR